jgi:putative two-component system response regulator
VRLPVASPKPIAPVLVVDDDPAVRRVLEVALRQLDYQVRTAEGVAAAREFLRSHACSTILCDYDMPGASGLDLLAHVTEVHPQIPFLLITGHDRTGLACDAIANGAADFLTKPFNLAQLDRQIQQSFARTERDQERISRVTEGMLKQTLRALVAAVDAKDPFTARHSERVTTLALKLGAAAGLNDDLLRVLEFSALMHDVGKIAIPDRILLKAGPLTEEERVIMRTHPIRSAEIVGEIGELRRVAAIVRHHHEWLDGTGYPDGLAGEAISPLARLLTIVDVYEASTTDRSYRPAMPPAVARQLIRNRIGTQFDPDYAGLFLALPEPEVRATCEDPDVSAHRLSDSEAVAMPAISR